MKFLNLSLHTYPSPHLSIHKALQKGDHNIQLKSLFWVKLSGQEWTYDDASDYLEEKEWRQIDNSKLQEVYLTR